MSTEELTLPGVSEEDLQEIADIEAELKAMYDKEEETGQPTPRVTKIELNERHRAAVAKGFENRMKVINADPALKQLHSDLAQDLGDKVPEIDINKLTPDEQEQYKALSEKASN